MSVRPRQLRLGGTSDEEGTSGSQLAELYGSASGVASWRADTRRLVLSDSDSEAEEPAAAHEDNTPGAPALLPSEVQNGQAADGIRSTSSSAESMPLQFSRRVPRGSRGRQRRLSDNFEEARLEGDTPAAAGAGDDLPNVSPDESRRSTSAPLTFTRSVTRRRAVRFRLSSQFEGSDSDSSSAASQEKQSGRAGRRSVQFARQPACMQSLSQTGLVHDDPYNFSSGDDMIGLGREGTRTQLAGSDRSSAIVISDSDGDSAADGLRDHEDG